MIAAARAFQLISLIVLTIASCVSFIFYVQTANAQSAAQSAAQANGENRQRIESLEIGAARAQGEFEAIPRRLDVQDNRQTATELRVTALESSLSRVYGFGGGIAALLGLLQVFQILQGIKKNP